jgi:hypothetical protein
VPYFKERSPSGEIQHRVMHMPTAAEALAEAALLEECAYRLSIPDPGRCYSYWPTKGASAKGYFEPYLTGLKERQRAVADAIQEAGAGVLVRYLDIKAFYPSIRLDVARAAWDRYCLECAIAPEFRKLGESILLRHEGAGSGKSILTGPMFSHFIGNLVLRDIDQTFGEIFRAKIFRYVDDYILVGQEDDVAHDVELLTQQLAQLGLEVHPDDSEKSMRLAGAVWLKSERDFESGEISTGWMKLVGDIKKLLIFNISHADDLLNELRELGFRLPVRAYEAAVREASTFEKIREFGLWGWLYSRVRGVSADVVRQRALRLRGLLEGQIGNLLDLEVPDDNFERKRLATKLRYRIGRALYLSEDEFLGSLHQHAEKWPELEVHFAIADALVSKTCDRVAAMGVNVAQAAAQLFSAADETALFAADINDESTAMGLAVFVVNGVPVQAQTVVDRPILQLATGPISLDLMQESGGFLQEFACLHGSGDVRHADVMSKAFDLAEDVHFDAIALDYGYSL